MPESVAEALGRFSETLASEVAFQEIEEQKERRKISALRITDAFKKVSPQHDEEDVRMVMMESIADASSLEALDTSMPLIQGLYGSSVSAIKEYKAEVQDDLLTDYAETEGYTGPAGLLGATQLKLLEYETSQEYNLESYDKDKGTIWTKYDRNDEEIASKVLDNRTDQDKLDFDIKKFRAQENIRASLRPRSEFITYAGTTPEGLPVSFNKQENMFYIPYTDTNGKVSMRPYGGDVLRGTKTALDQGMKQQDLYTQARKEVWIAGNSNAQNILNKLGLSIPSDYSGDPNEAAFGFLQGKSEKEINTALESAGFLNSDGTVNKDMQAEYNVINQQIQTFEDSKMQARFIQSKLNTSTDIVDYEKALGTYGLSPQDFSAFYNKSKRYIVSQDPTQQAGKEVLRDIIVEEYNKVNKGNRLKESDIASADDTQWIQWFERLNNISKGRVMNKVRDAEDYVNNQ